MQAQERDPPTGLRPVHGVAGAALLILLVEHVVHGVRRLPAAYGGDSATEYLEHVRRMEFFALLRDLPRHDAATMAWRALDRVEFPPLLVLFQYPLDLLFGPHPGVAVAANLGWLALAGLATFGLARSLDLASVAPWAAVLLLLLPGMWGPARTYYYDVPMIALITVGVAASVECVQRPRLRWVLLAAAAFAAAELTKWEGVLYVAAALPAILAVAVLAEGSRKRRCVGVVGVLAGCGAAAGIVAAYVSRHRGAWDARFGQVVALNQGENPEGGLAAVFSGLTGRLVHAGPDAWTFYPQWLTASSLGLVIVALGVVAATRLGRVPRIAAVSAVLAMLGTLAAVVGVSDIQEVRFVHPALPWLAVLLAAGLGALPGKVGRAAPAVAVVLATSQLLAADYVHEPDGSALREGVVDVPRPARALLGASLSPLPQSPGNQTGWRRPVDHRASDALGMRTAIAWIAQAADGRPARVALHPLNLDLGRAEYAWSFWALHRAARLETLPGRPIEDCTVDPDRADVRAADFVVVDFDPALLGGGGDAWCRAVQCSGDGRVADADPCGFADAWLGFGAGWRIGPPIPYRSRTGRTRDLWVLERGGA